MTGCLRHAATFTGNGYEQEGGGQIVLYMVIERYPPGGVAAVYQRFRERGRLAPDGLTYVSSWVDLNLSRCFQVMECEDASLLSEWIAQWHDLVEFEVVPVLASEQAAQVVTGSS